VAAVAIAAIDSLDRIEKNPDVHITNFGEL
jgi:hypothetical protein